MYLEIDPAKYESVRSCGGSSFHGKCPRVVSLLWSAPDIQNRMPRPIGSAGVGSN